MDIVLVVINFPNAAVARQIGTVLIKEHLAACVNLIPNIESIYLWEGKLEFTNEVTALVKSSADNYQKLQERVLEMHPYENPEVLKLPIQEGAEAYLRWVGTATSKTL